MWLAFPSLFDFGRPVPGASELHTHVSYFLWMRVMDMHDDLPKWSGHKNKSVLL